jgi:hypothetical protein
MKLSAACWKALLLGVVMGSVVAMTPSCGPRPSPTGCTLETCKGCCTAGQECLVGLSDVACGSSGATCMTCSGGQVCAPAIAGGSGGRCLAPGSTGGGSAVGGGSAGGGSAGGGSAGGTGGGSTGGGTGGSTGGGSGSCNAQNCATGCCTSTGSCQNPGTTARCGTGGAACTSCPSRQTCESGACAPCNGCVDLATGRCETGSTANLCGKNGEFCANCSVSNAVCTNQVCVGNMTSCNATNCASGCCDQGSGMCVLPPSQSGAQCGRGVAGALCTSCPSNRCDTDAGVCIGGSGGGGAGGGAGGGFFPPIDGGLPGSCDANNPCPAGNCCLTLGPLSTCIMAVPGLLTSCGTPAVCCSFGQMCVADVCQ